jgi:hypothetical protein
VPRKRSQRLCIIRRRDRYVLTTERGGLHDANPLAISGCHPNARAVYEAKVKEVTNCKVPVASFCQSVSVLSSPPGEYTRLSVIGLLGVKPVPEILPPAWSRVMSAVETGTSCPPLAA